MTSGGFVGEDLFIREDDQVGTFREWFGAWIICVIAALCAWPVFVFLKLRAWLYRLGAAPRQG